MTAPSSYPRPEPPSTATQTGPARPRSARQDQLSRALRGAHGNRDEMSSARSYPFTVERRHKRSTAVQRTVPAQTTDTHSPCPQAPPTPTGSHLSRASSSETYAALPSTRGPYCCRNRVSTWPCSQPVVSSDVGCLVAGECRLG